MADNQQEKDVRRYNEIAAQIAAISDDDLLDKFEEQIEAADRMGVPRAQALWGVRSQLLNMAVNAEMEGKIAERQEAQGTVFNKMVLALAGMLLVMMQVMKKARKRALVLLASLENAIASANNRITKIEEEQAAKDDGLNPKGPILSKSVVAGDTAILASFAENPNSSGMLSRKFEIVGTDASGLFYNAGEYSVKFSYSSGSLLFYQLFSSYDVFVNAGSVGINSPDGKRLQVLVTSGSADMNWRLQEVPTVHRPQTRENPVY